MIKKRISVMIIGQPNSGKSTLINKLFGKSIICTTNRPNSTRKIITAIIKHKNTEIVLYDTPGIGYSKKQKFLYNITGKAASKQNDTIILLLDGTKKDIPHHLFQYIPPNKNIGIVVNKVDLNKQNLIKLKEKAYEKLRHNNNILFWEYISALQQDGLDLLLDHLDQHAQPAESIILENYTSQTIEDLAIQALRQSLFKHLKEEIPYQANHQVCLIDNCFRYLITVKKSHKPIILSQISKIYKSLRYALKDFSTFESDCQISVKTQ